MNHSRVFSSQITSTFRIVNSNTFARLQNLYSLQVKEHSAKKGEFLEIFSSENWDNLKERKTKHSLIDCKACLHNKKLRSTLAMIPIKSPAYIQKAKKAGLIESMVLQEKTKQIVTDLNRGYRKNYRTTFTTQFKKTLNVPTVKKTAKLIKKNIEELWEKT